MAHTVTIGGDRLGSGKKMKAELHGYERSTHDLGFIFRSTMSSGTLVPFLVEIGLPGDTFDIDLNTIVKTHPTIGPLFGSYKVQLDIFECPVRLYQGKLHNNALNIGLNMANIKLPVYTLYAAPEPSIVTDTDNYQISPDCILSYLGQRGVGFVENGDPIRPRDLQCVPFLAYWDIYKNYYANKQEEIGAVIHTPRAALVTTITGITMDGNTIPQNTATTTYTQDLGSTLIITYSGATPDTSQVEILVDGQWYPLLTFWSIASQTGTTIDMYFSQAGPGQLGAWRYISPDTPPYTSPQVATFALDNIDDMRNAILAWSQNSSAYNINGLDLAPYEWIALPSAPATVADIPYTLNQEGLAIKTYQSDLFNNWIRTEWIDGPDGITELTSIDTSSGSFSIDQLNLSKKVYNMLNRIAISGGSYKDWINAAYDHMSFSGIESPVYHGGLSKELVFEEIVSNSASDAEGTQPLGTLAGKGVMAGKHKGGQIHIKVHEPSIIMGIVSLTPRVDYSQGNMWFTKLLTMDDFHKPDLDEIGFQELITDQMAWWTTAHSGGGWTQKSAGKQPAWINYMTNVNKCFGNFARKNNEMFMTLNRMYEYDFLAGGNIDDLTTYIDPVKFNHIFAQTSIDAQNFWVQIAIDNTARRKMSAKVMPNL